MPRVNPVVTRLAEQILSGGISRGKVDEIAREVGLNERDLADLGTLLLKGSGLTGHGRAKLSGPKGREQYFQHIFEARVKVNDPPKR